MAELHRSRWVRLFWDIRKPFVFSRIAPRNRRMIEEFGGIRRLRAHSRAFFPGTNPVPASARQRARPKAGASVPAPRTRPSGSPPARAVTTSRGPASSSASRLRSGHPPPPLRSPGSPEAWRSAFVPAGLAPRRRAWEERGKFLEESAGLLSPASLGSSGRESCKEVKYAAQRRTP